MTIQLSVTIWTIICFVLLMLILHFLLFKPVLKVMDDRRMHIQKAAQRKAENERLESEYASMLSEQKKAYLEAQSAFNKVISGVNEILSYHIRGEEAAGGCSGNCSGCSGCH